MNIKVTYLYHSSFAVETPSRFLIFDYYQDTPRGAGLSEGVVDPAELAGKQTVVFASHRHPDHYSSVVFDWREKIPDIRYVLSDDIPADGPAERMRPGETRSLDGLTVRTLQSTDEGVAFLVKADGFCVYHAGDLNWWKWDENSDAENRRMERDYKREVEKLKGEKINLAFLPVDPRQEEDALLGIGFFMETVGADHVVPMHAFGHPEFFDLLKTDPRAASYRERVWFYRRRGEEVSYTPARSTCSASSTGIGR